MSSMEGMPYGGLPFLGTYCPVPDVGFNLLHCHLPDISNVWQTVNILIIPYSYSANFICVSGQTAQKIFIVWYSVILMCLQ